jgi:hypothetical protein
LYSRKIQSTCERIPQELSGGAEPFHRQQLIHIWRVGDFGGTGRAIMTLLELQI